MSIDTQGLTGGNSSTISRGVKSIRQGGAELEGVAQRTSRTKIARERAPVKDIKITEKPKLSAKEAKLDKKIGNYQKVGNIGGKIFNFEFFGGMVGTFLATQATKFGKTKLATVLYGMTGGIIDTLKELRLNTLHLAPQKYLKNVSNFTKRTGGKASAEWAEGIESAAHKAGNAAESRLHKVKNSVEPMASSIEETVTRSLDKFSETGVGGHVEDQLQKLQGWRATSAEANQAKALAKAELALTKPKGSFFSPITNFFTSSKPALEALHPELEKLASHITNAKAASGVERIAHLESATTELEALASNGAKAVKARAADVAKHIDISSRAAELSETLGHVKTEGLSGMMKSFGKAVSNTKVLPVIFGVSAVAAIGAILLTEKKQSAEATKAYNDLANDIGADKNHPLMQNITKGFKAQVKGNKLGAGMSTIGEVGTAAMFMSPHGGGAAVFGASMLPMLNSFFVKDSTELNAYSALKQAEAGTAKLEPEQKLNFTKQLIAVVPAVAANGGIYNKLVGPVAEEILTRKLTVRDTMKLLANEKEFTALASSVLEKQKAAETPKAEKAATPAEAEQNRSNMHVVKPTAEEAYHAAEKPAGKVVAMQHEGTVLEQHKALSA